MWVNHEEEQKKKLNEPLSMIDDSIYNANSVWDENNSKDFGRRSIAMEQNSIAHIKYGGNQDGSFKLKRIDHHKFNNANYNDS